MITGIIIGSMVSAGGAVFAESPSIVFARIMNAVRFEFNGEVKEVPEEYTVLNYKDRTYVPARFVAESLDAEVQWDTKTNTIKIESKEKQENVEEDKETSKVTYDKLPIKKMVENVWIHITGMKADEKETWIYLEVENKGENPVQIDQAGTKIVVGEKIYNQKDLRNVLYPYDQIWFNDIRKDDEVKGFIKMPLLEEEKDSKNITLKLKMIQNDGSQKETEVEFNIAL